MCLHVLACIGLAYVVPFVFFVVVAFCLLLVTILALASEPFLSPGPVLDPHSLGSLWSEPGRLCDPTRLSPLAAALVVEHAALALVLVAVYHRLRTQPCVVERITTVHYGTVDLER